ncbi:uncharacterized protein N7459_007155 [Penicillium hispanicum]|uniref:uncharacterized protein n=1 Tax=Penicillium hispanicum TaxID=1080232 RepID=UPI002541321A|nr:uncharacterized protein N7459_007155 [Penicillium hispanicum]KAJ5578191.1 hypothetical protein N7459_007155 [Penicillium hispanicum]
MRNADDDHRHRTAGQCWDETLDRIRPAGVPRTLLDSTLRAPRWRRPRPMNEPEHWYSTAFRAHYPGYHQCEPCDIQFFTDDPIGDGQCSGGFPQIWTVDGPGEHQRTCAVVSRSYLDSNRTSTEKQHDA